ncbi:MAG: TonB-dependent receptor [Bacteroidales bacterium]
MKKILLMLAIIVPTMLVSAQNSSNKELKGKVIDTLGEPLMGANVYWKGSTQGAVSDENGEFSLERVKENTALITSYVGYNSDTTEVKHNRKDIVITLSENITLSEVTISERRQATLKGRLEVIQTEKITFDELCRAACCNLSESFVTNPSVDVSYSDAATGAKQIRLLGLSGAYVQMLTENATNFRGAASLYGLDYVPGNWMESIQVSKGTSSVKNGYEAVTGQINVEYKKPQTADPLSVNLFASDAGRVEANVDGALMLNKYLGVGLLTHYSRDKVAHDRNKDGFLDQPQTEQINLMNRWYYKRGNYIGQVGVKYIREERNNGQEDHSSNMESEHEPYKIGISTNRGEFFSKHGYVLNPEKGSSVAMILSGSIHDQKSTFGHTNYNLKQDNVNASLLYETSFGKMHKLSTGASFNWDRLTQSGSLEQFNNPTIQVFRPTRSEFVPGVFAEYTLNLNDKFVALAGIRADHHNEYGLFATPRLHLKWNQSEYFDVRASVGKGYRSVNLLPEYNYLFASNRIKQLSIADNLPMEDATNMGLTLTGHIKIAGKELTLTGEVFHTNFNKQVVVDMDSNPNAILFYPLVGKSYATNYQIEANYPAFRGFTVTAAFRTTNAKTTYQGVLRDKPLTSRYKGLLTTSYQTPLKKWQFDLTAQFNGKGRMPLPDAENPLWDNEYKPFTMLNAQVTKYFRTWSIYLGAENLLDFRQKNPIIGADDPFGDNFDATMVWGPIHGRKLYVGMRWALPTKK